LLILFRLSVEVPAISLVLRLSGSEYLNGYPDGFEPAINPYV